MVFDIYFKFNQHVLQCFKSGLVYNVFATHNVKFLGSPLQTLKKFSLAKVLAQGEFLMRDPLIQTPDALHGCGSALAWHVLAGANRCRTHGEASEIEQLS